MKFGNARRPDPIIDVTPMIDIVFQLVLFFMVSTQFVQHPGIQVSLPRSSAQTVLTDKTNLNVWITTEGSIFVDDVPVTSSELSDIFRRRAKADSGSMVVIKADEGVSHGRVISVMDMAQARGLSNLALATDPGEGEE